MSSMKRVTIYVDEGLWDEVKEAAYRARISAGAYLMNLHQARLVARELGFDPENLTLVDDGKLAEIIKPNPVEQAAVDLEKLIKEKDVPWAGGYSKEKQAGRKKKK